MQVYFAVNTSFFCVCSCTLTQKSHVKDDPTDPFLRNSILFRRKAFGSMLDPHSKPGVVRLINVTHAHSSISVPYTHTPNSFTYAHTSHILPFILTHTVFPFIIYKHTPGRICLRSLQTYTWQNFPSYLHTPGRICHGSFWHVWYMLCFV